jgi:hypothetical protein
MTVVRLGDTGSGDTGAGRACPIPGNRGYIDWLEEYRQFLTDSEWRAQRRLHFNLFRILASVRPPSDPRFIEARLRAIDEAIAASGSYNPPHRTDRQLRLVRPSEIRSSSLTCRYPDHRTAGDWLDADGNAHCGICHPPVPGAEA